MKSEWTSVKLKDIISFVVDNRGKTPPTQDSGYPLLEVNAISKDYKFPQYQAVRKYVSREVYDTKFRKGHPQIGDILVPTVGTLGAVSYVNRSDCCIAQNVVSLRTNNLLCDSNFLYYILKNPITRDRLLNLNIGGVQPSIKVPHLLDLELDIPSLEEQKQIVLILSALDNKIELNNKTNDNLEQQTQALYHNQFENVDKTDLPVGWRVVNLGEVATISKKTFNPEKENETELEHYSIPAFDEAKFPVFESSKLIKSNKYVIDESCFMISKLNPIIKRVWRPYCLTKNAVCSTEFIVYKAKDVSMTDYLYSVVDSASFTDFMCSHVTGSTGSRQRTTPSDTLDFELVMPSEKELQNFQALVSPMYAQMKYNAIENDKLKKLRDVLLPKLMAGEIAGFK